MPRDGAVILSDVRNPTLSIVCEPCGRRGAYSSSSVSHPWRGSKRLPIPRVSKTKTLLIVDLNPAVSSKSSPLMSLTMRDPLQLRIWALASKPLPPRVRATTAILPSSGRVSVGLTLIGRLPFQTPRSKACLVYVNTLMLQRVLAEGSLARAHDRGGRPWADAARLGPCQSLRRVRPRHGTAARPRAEGGCVASTFDKRWQTHQMAKTHSFAVTGPSPITRFSCTPQVQMDAFGYAWTSCPQMDCLVPEIDL